MKPRRRRPEVTLKTWRAKVGAAGSLNQGGDGGLASLGETVQPKTKVKLDVRQAQRSKRNGETRHSQRSGSLW